MSLGNSNKRVQDKPPDKGWWILKLFPRYGQSQIVTTDILWPLLKTQTETSSCRDRSLVEIIKRCSDVKDNCFEYLVIIYAQLQGPGWNYGIRDERGLGWTVYCVFRDALHVLGTKHLWTTTYHPQTYGELKRVGQQKIFKMRLYVVGNQWDWDIHM